MALTSSQLALQGLESRLTTLENSFEQLRKAIAPELAVANIAAPIALTFLRIEAQHAFSSRFFALIDLGEALIKYAAAITFASVSMDKGLANEIGTLFKTPPSLGKLVGQMRTIIDSNIAEDQWHLRLVRDAFKRSNGKLTPHGRYFFDEFIAIRNSERGHGAQQPEGYYEDKYLNNRSIIEDFVESATFLSIGLVNIYSVDHHDHQFRYKVTRLMGAAPVGQRDDIISTTRVKSKATCLSDKGILLPLDDFLVYRFCKFCNSEHTFFADRISEGKVSLQSYPGSHRIDCTSGS